MLFCKIVVTFLAESQKASPEMAAYTMANLEINPIISAKHCHNKFTQHINAAIAALFLCSLCAFSNMFRTISTIDMIKPPKQMVPNCDFKPCDNDRFTVPLNAVVPEGAKYHCAVEPPMVNNRKHTATEDVQSKEKNSNPTNGFTHESVCHSQQLTS